ncbi:MAG: tRNA (adenosine(37)-N6)-threonylcarbamoyltransferase complex transferase subunit TsaD [Deltaproteobacteria bacterium]|nr:tRNA (adenosine(37)-N6)-threonylcarbamoyltransferase complex transferase subunit TsaD [Deltaproteobacteria bacterium]
MLVLGIETSCDETAAAVVRDGRELLSSVVASQADLHGVYGGVVPELASRRHVEAVLPVVAETLRKAGCGLDEIDGIAVTRGPGLVGALLVGLSVAKALAYVRQIPFVGVNHLEGHLLAIQLEETVAFPFLGFVVSGGHTSLYVARDVGLYACLGRTRDDAAGEAFDKVAKLLGLGYPGGMLIDRLAERGDPQAYRFPRALLSDPDSLDFSFSGLKTAVAHLVAPCGVREGEVPDLAASVQEAIVDVLVTKAVRAARLSGLRDLVVAGGVSANRRLRTRLQEAAAAEGLALHIPSPGLCTDNAAMIAAAGTLHLARGERSDFDLNAAATLPL